MRHPMLLEAMMKRPLWVAVAAVFVSGCATTQPVAQSPMSSEPVSRVDPADAAGTQGTSGDTGARGASPVGADGARGPTGPVGGQGVAGGVGAGGPTPGGATGPASPVGVAAVRGAQGPTGIQGSLEDAGISGPTTETDSAAPQGPIGSIGTHGPTAAISGWSAYRVYSFYSDSNAIVRSDENKTLEIANQIERNPSFRLGLDGANSMRVGNVRDALIKAGVPPYKIQVGDFGDPRLRRDSRVGVLLRN